MRAAVVAAPGRIEIVEAPTPEPGPSEVRVRLEGCGVCASNVPPWEGREWFSYPMEPGALGHEGWGVVDALGADVEGLAPGDRVGFLSGHAYAEYDVTEPGSLVKLPPVLEGRPFPAEPLGCAVNVFRRAKVVPDAAVAIVGIGFLGAILVGMAARAGARVIALDRKASALRIAAEAGAAETVLMDDHWRVLERVKELTGGAMCATTIEVTGKEWPLNLAAEITGEYGHLVVAGYHQDGLRAVNMQLWNWRCLTVTNAHERDPGMYRRGMEAAAAMAASGELDPTPLFTHTVPLERLGEALDLARERPEGFMKALVAIS